MLYRLRCALRPTHSVDTATGALVEKPPLIDLRHRQNIFCLHLTRTVLFYLGREFRLRLQAAVGYALAFALGLLVWLLLLAFGGGGSAGGQGTDVGESMVVGAAATAGVLSATVLVVLALAFKISDKANFEPTYLRHAVLSQSIVLQSEITALEAAGGDPAHEQRARKLRGPS